MADGIELPLPIAQTGYYLRDVTSNDAQAYQTMYEKLKESGQYYAFLWNFEKTNGGGAINSSAVGARFVHRCLNSQQIKPRTEHRLAICNPDHIVIGSAVILLNSNEDNDPRLNSGGELGCFISPEHQGRDIGTMAVATLAEAALKNLGLRSFWGKAHPDNKASLKIFEKLGMRLLGEAVSREDLRAPARLLFIGNHAPSITKQ